MTLSSWFNEQILKVKCRFIPEKDKGSCFMSLKAFSRSSFSSLMPFQKQPPQPKTSNLPCNHHAQMLGQLCLHSLDPDCWSVSVHDSRSLTHHSEPLGAHHHLLLVGREEELPRGGFDFKHLASRFKSTGS